MRPAHITPPGRVCETRCKRAGLAIAVFLAVLAVGAAPRVLAQAAPAQPQSGDHAAPPAAQAAGPQGTPAAHDATAAAHVAGEAAADEHAEEHETSPWGLIGKIVNFAVLVGVLVYFARQPFARYLSDRSTQIREDLDRAAEMKDDAGRQIADIEAKLRQLPGELDALRERGREEVAAEQARIEEAAAHERDRLLEQTRREIESQLRVARRELVTHAADLAVRVARERIRHRITSEDQARLVDRYMEQVKAND